MAGSGGGVQRSARAGHISGPRPSPYLDGLPDARNEWVGGDPSCAKSQFFGLLRLAGETGIYETAVSNPGHSVAGSVPWVILVLCHL
jgi:hypothetical protein